MEYYIYTLTDPIDGIIKYIGKTKNIEKRLKRHMSDWSINSEPWTRKNKWLKWLKNSNLMPIIESIDNGDSNNINNLEKYWISQFKCWGFKLKNQTDGGDGVDWTGKKHKESTKELLRTGNKNIKSVVLFDSEMNPLKKFISVREAERITGVKRQLLKFSCKGRGKAAGCYFKFSDIIFNENENWIEFLKFRKYNYDPVSFDISKEELVKLIHLSYKEILEYNNIEYKESTRQKLMKIMKKYKFIK